MRRREFIAGSAGLLAGSGFSAATSTAHAESVRGIKGPFRVIDLRDHFS